MSIFHYVVNNAKREGLLLLQPIVSSTYVCEHPSLIADFKLLPLPRALGIHLTWPVNVKATLAALSQLQDLTFPLQFYLPALILAKLRPLSAALNVQALGLSMAYPLTVALRQRCKQLFKSNPSACWHVEIALTQPFAASSQPSWHLKALLETALSLKHLQCRSLSFGYRQTLNVQQDLIYLIALKQLAQIFLPQLHWHIALQTSPHLFLSTRNNAQAIFEMGRQICAQTDITRWLLPWQNHSQQWYTLRQFIKSPLLLAKPSSLIIAKAKALVVEVAFALEKQLEASNAIFF